MTAGSMNVCWTPHPCPKLLLRANIVLLELVSVASYMCPAHRWPEFYFCLVFHKQTRDWTLDVHWTLGVHWSSSYHIPGALLSALPEWDAQGGAAHRLCTFLHHTDVDREASQDHTGVNKIQGLTLAPAAPKDTADALGTCKVYPHAADSPLGGWGLGSTTSDEVLN